MSRVPSSWCFVDGVETCRNIDYAQVDGDDALDAAVDALGLEPHRVLAFVDDAALLREAKRCNLRTVQFVGENEELPVRRDRRPDYDVSACADVVGVIDELNGLSFRGGSAM